MPYSLFPRYSNSNLRFAGILSADGGSSVLFPKFINGCCEVGQSSRPRTMPRRPPRLMHGAAGPQVDTKLSCRGRHRKVAPVSSGNEDRNYGN
jgi:hypothetical protein